jgi:hypothetical protein
VTNQSLAHLAQDAVAQTVSATTGLLGPAYAAAQRAVNAALDAAVPVIATAIVDRIDLKPIVERAISELNLTNIVLQNVDVDAIVASADLDPILDRLPLADLAEYVVNQIDLPAIIRSSTGGIAVDALSNARVGAMAADQMLARATDAILLKRGRNTASRLADEMARDAEDGIANGQWEPMSKPASA